MFIYTSFIIAFISLHLNELQTFIYRVIFKIYIKFIWNMHDISCKRKY
jgi:hypothetical protein